MMSKAPFGHDAPPAADNACSTSRRERDVAQQYPGVNREIIDTLLALFEECVAINVPRQILGFATDLFEGLINGNSADGNRRIAQNPFACGVNVLAGGEVHHSVGTPER